MAFIVIVIVHATNPVTCIVSNLLLYMRNGNCYKESFYHKLIREISVISWLLITFKMSTKSRVHDQLYVYFSDLLYGDSTICSSSST